DKVNHTLCWGDKAAAAKVKSFPLHLALEIQQGKGIFQSVRDVIQINLYHCARIGMRIIALRGRPTIHHDFFFIGSARCYNAPRTHTERKHATVVDLLHQTVIGWGKVFMAHSTVILRLIDDLLWMFDTHAQSKRFGFDKPTFTTEELKNVTCRMPCSDNYMLAFDVLAICRPNAFYFTEINKDIVYSTVEMDFSPVL